MHSARTQEKCIQVQGMQTGLRHLEANEICQRCSVITSGSLRDLQALGLICETMIDHGFLISRMPLLSDHLSIGPVVGR